jgi:predicted metal-dependent peptidase
MESDIKIKNQPVKVSQIKTVDEATKQRALLTALYACRSQYPFYGAALQSLNISWSHQIPTAGVVFNKETRNWSLLINEDFFCRKITSDNTRLALLLHEIMHITHQHTIRVPFMNLSPKRRQLMNIAADASINSLIRDLPDGCEKCRNANIEQIDLIHKEDNFADCPGKAILPEMFHEVDANGNKIPLRHGMTMEQIYLKLLALYEDPDKSENSEKDELGDEEDGSNYDDNNQDKIPRALDSHDWSDGDIPEKDIIDASVELIKRAMIKANTSYSNLPGAVRDLLDYAEKRKAELNYRAILQRAMRKNMPGNTRKYTWRRESRRHGDDAPGTTIGDLPRLDIAIDTSGSISVEEINTFLGVIDGLLTVGHRKCDINLFHTEEYLRRVYRRGDRLKQYEVQSGGTDLTATLRRVAKMRPNLTIILTDGYFSYVNVKDFLKFNQRFPATVFVISPNGTKDHPFAKESWATTVQIPK